MDLGWSVCFYSDNPITQLSAAAAAGDGKADEATRDRSLVTERCSDAVRIYSIKICRGLASYKFRFLTRFSAAGEDPGIDETPVVDVVSTTSDGRELFTDKRAAATTREHRDGLDKLSETKTPRLEKDPAVHEYCVINHADATVLQRNLSGHSAHSDTFE